MAKMVENEILLADKIDKKINETDVKNGSLY